MSISSTSVNDLADARLRKCSQLHITGKDTLRVLVRDFGWYVARQAGSHAHLKHRSQQGRVTVPVHAGEILKPKTMASILDQAGIELDEFVRML
jgi:predicted RNA binding protein YcfA (HicA-like mRNA interferase family)